MLDTNRSDLRTSDSVFSFHSRGSVGSVQDDRIGGRCFDPQCDQFLFED